MITEESLGVSTACLYPMYTEEAFDKLLAQGYRVFEVFVNAYQEFSPAFMKRLRQKGQEYGVIFTSVHPFTSLLESMLLFERYDRRTEEGIELYKRFMESAAVLGAKYVVIHGQHAGTGGLHMPAAAKKHSEDERYWEVFGRLYRAGYEIGAFPIQENVRLCRSAAPDFIRGMRQHLGEDCAFVLDIKQCRVSGVAIDDMLAAMGTRLRHIHLSDCSRDFPCLLPGFGDFDFRAFWQKLDGMDYDGRLVTEVYNTSYGDLSELSESRRRMRLLFA